MKSILPKGSIQSVVMATEQSSTETRSGIYYNVIIVLKDEKEYPIYKMYVYKDAEGKWGFCQSLRSGEARQDESGKFDFTKVSGFEKAKKKKL